MSVLPKLITRFFWGDNLKQLSLKKHPKYIIETILEKGDLPATKWLLKKTTKKNLKKSISSKMSKKSRNFWQIYLG